MQGGALRQRVTIQRLSEVLNAYGEVEKTWTPVATIWAGIEPLAGREYLQAQQVQAEVTHRVRVRYRDGLEPKMRLALADGRALEIEAVLDIEARGREVHLMCREIV